MAFCQYIMAFCLFMPLIFKRCHARMCFLVAPQWLAVDALIWHNVCIHIKAIINCTRFITVRIFTDALYTADHFML